MKSLIFTAALILSQSGQAYDSCQQVADLNSQLTTCQANLGNINAQLSQAQARMDQLIREINSPDQGAALARCQRDSRDLNDQLNRILFRVDRSRQEARDLAQINRENDAWFARNIVQYECTFVDVDEGNAVSYNGISPRDAEEKLSSDRSWKKFRANGYYKFCYPAYRQGQRPPQDGDRPRPGPGPGRP